MGVKILLVGYFIVSAGLFSTLKLAGLAVDMKSAIAMSLSWPALAPLYIFSSAYYWTKKKGY